MKCLYIDIGSVTIKSYLSESGKLTHIKNQSINFKKDFDPENGISSDSAQALFDLLVGLKEEFKDVQIKTFATAIFRKINQPAKQRLIDNLFIKSGIFLNIVGHELENFYLEKALIERCNVSDPMLLINIGGGSTELVVVQNKQPIEKHNIDLGVGTVNVQFPSINAHLSEASLNDVISFVKQKLPELKNKVEVGFYSGGELRYTTLAKYNLIPNVLFEDEDHPLMLSLADFQSKNHEIFEKTPISDLEKLMPENPTWMHGARGCSAIAQAICEKYHITSIIPSDADLPHGAVRQEFRHVTLIGSFRKHLSYILQIKKQLEENNIKILSPRFTKPNNPGEEFVVFSGEEGMAPLELERHHLDSIAACDALIVCDPEGYVGASALIEIGYAQSLGKRVIFTEKPQEFMLKTLPSEIGL